MSLENKTPSTEQKNLFSGSTSICSRDKELSNGLSGEMEFKDFGRFMYETFVSYRKKSPIYVRVVGNITFTKLENPVKQLSGAIV